jgi:hypothetical protein
VGRQGAAPGPGAGGLSAPNGGELPLARGALQIVAATVDEADAEPATRSGDFSHAAGPPNRHVGPQGTLE